MPCASDVAQTPCACSRLGGGWQRLNARRRQGTRYREAGVNSRSMGEVDVALMPLTRRLEVGSTGQEHGDAEVRFTCEERRLGLAVTE